MEFGLIHACGYSTYAFVFELFVSIYTFGSVALLILLPLKALFDRYSSDPIGTFDACEYILQNLAKSHRGAFYKFDSRRLVCLLPERNLYMEVERELSVQLRIHKEWPNKKSIWKKWLRCGEVSEENITGWIKCAEMTTERHERFSLNTLNTEQRCGFCREWLETNKVSVRCFNCSAPYHLECFELNCGCGVFGCGPQQSLLAKNSVRSIHDKAKSHIE